MKLADYIKILQEIQAVEGEEIEVETRSMHFDRISAPKPIVSYKKVLTGRQSKSDFWDSYNSENLRGQKIVKV